MKIFECWTVIASIESDSIAISSDLSIIYVRKQHCE